MNSPKTPRPRCNALLPGGDARCRTILPHSALCCTYHSDAYDASYEAYKAAAGDTKRLRRFAKLKRSGVQQLSLEELPARTGGVRAYIAAANRELELRRRHDQLFIGPPDEGHQMHLNRLEEQGAHARELLHAIEKRRQYLEQQARRAPSRTRLSRPVRALRQSKLSRPSSPVPKKARRRKPKAEEERRARARAEARKMREAEHERQHSVVLEAEQRMAHEGLMEFVRSREFAVNGSLTDTVKGAPEEAFLLPEDQAEVADIAWTEDSELAELEDVEVCEEVEMGDQAEQEDAPIPNEQFSGFGRNDGGASSGLLFWAELLRQELERRPNERRAAVDVLGEAQEIPPQSPWLEDTCPSPILATPTSPVDDIVPSIQVLVDVTCSDDGLMICLDADTLDARTASPWPAPEENDVFNFLSSAAPFGHDSEWGSIREPPSPNLPRVAPPLSPGLQACVLDEKEDAIPSVEECSLARMPRALLLLSEGDELIDIPCDFAVADNDPADEQLRPASPSLGWDECEARTCEDVKPCIPGAFSPGCFTHFYEDTRSNAFSKNVEAQGISAHVTEDDEGPSDSSESLASLVGTSLSVIAAGFIVMAYRSPGAWHLLVRVARKVVHRAPLRGGLLG